MDHEKFTMFSAAPGGAWSQEAMQDMERASSSASTERPSTSKESLALRKKIERAHTTALWSTLIFLAPNVDLNKGQPGFSSRFPIPDIWRCDPTLLAGPFWQHPGFSS